MTEYEISCKLFNDGTYDLENLEYVYYEVYDGYEKFISGGVGKFRNCLKNGVDDSGNVVPIIYVHCLATGRDVAIVLNSMKYTMDIFIPLGGYNNGVCSTQV